MDEIKQLIAALAAETLPLSIPPTELAEIFNRLADYLNSALAENYKFGGVISLSSNPSSSDSQAFYIAGPGTYTNFENTTVPAGCLGVFIFKLGQWSYKILDFASSLGNKNDLAAPDGTAWAQIKNNNFLSNKSLLPEWVKQINGSYNQDKYLTLIEELNKIYNVRLVWSDDIIPEGWNDGAIRIIIINALSEDDGDYGAAITLQVGDTRYAITPTEAQKNQTVEYVKTISFNGSSATLYLTLNWAELKPIGTDKNVVYNNASGIVLSPKTGYLEKEKIDALTGIVNQQSSLITTGGYPVWVKSIGGNYSISQIAQIIKNLKAIRDCYIVWDTIPEDIENNSIKIITLTAIGEGYPAQFIINVNGENKDIVYKNENPEKPYSYKVNIEYNGCTGVLVFVLNWQELTAIGTDKNVVYNGTAGIVLVPRINSFLEDIDSLESKVSELEANSVTLQKLEYVSDISKNYCDYFWISAETKKCSYTENASTDIEAFKTNVAKFYDFEDDTGTYLYGRFNGEDWLGKFKSYQSTDGAPVKMGIKVRVYNKNEQNKSVTFYFSVRYREGAGWVLPSVSKTVAANSYEDFTLEFTPNYLSLTTIIDSYCSVSNALGCEVYLGNIDLYCIDPKSRDPRPLINPKNIDSGITFDQLSDSLQGMIGTSDSFVPPITKQSIICSGSSITWGDGRLDGSFVANVDEFVKNRLSKTLLSDALVYSGDKKDVTNTLLYKDKGVKISGIGSKVIFTLTCDEVAICQMIERTADSYGIFTLKADGKVIGTYSNKNTIGSNSETFQESSIKKVRLKFPCTFEHRITINDNTVLSNVKFNTQGYGATIPSDAEAFVYRTLDDMGNPVHAIEFNDSFGEITKVSVEYKYGKIIAHERSTVGQIEDGVTNESTYGLGSVAFDPANPTGGISSGMEFRGIDERAFISFKFDSFKERTFEIEITGGNNPYFIVNYVTNRFHNLMNAGIGGWTAGALINNDKINDYTQFFKWFQPNVLFQESSTNDDWSYSTRRIKRSIGKISKEELVKMRSLDIVQIAYDDISNSYDTYMATGIISAFTANSLTSEDIKNSTVEIGDIVRIGTYHGDNRQTVCRKISAVDKSEGTISWIEPVNPDIMLNVETLDDFVGVEFNVRNLDAYKATYKSLIEKVREIAPQCKIVVVSSGLSMFGLRELWGYEIIHKELCAEYPNVYFCDVTNWLYDYMSKSISGSSSETIQSNGSDTYDLEFQGNNRSWQGFKVLVDGVDVYGKDCYIENQYYYRPDLSKSGADLNKSNAYDNKGVYTNPPKMALKFTKNLPSSGKEIVVQFADATWSGDYCHPSLLGAYIYGQIYSDFISLII